MTIQGVRGSDKTRDFNQDDIEAMRQDASTSTVLNKVRRDVGARTGDVEVRGDDLANAELRKKWEEHDFKDASIGAVRDVVIEGTEGTVLHGLLGPFFFAKEALHSLDEAEKRGEALALNNERGALHMAMLSAIDVPQGYKNVELGRWKEAGVGGTSGAAKMGTALRTIDKKEALVLQLHADRGMNAAKAMIDAGGITRDGDVEESGRALLRDPATKAKYDSDPAFRAGFDGLVWQFRHESKSAYDETVGRLQARDARYEQHAISFRG
jgi:hypothetical protein